MVNNRAKAQCERQGHIQDIHSSWMLDHKLVARCSNCDCIFDVIINQQNIDVLRNIQNYDFESEEIEKEIPYYARPHLKKSIISVFSFLFIFIPFIASAATVTINPVTDVELGTQETGVNWSGQSAATADTIDSSGVQSSIFVGYDGDTYIRRYALTFDTAEAVIPSGSTINSITLRLYVTGKNNVKGDAYSDVTINSFTPNDPTSLVIADYGECTATRYANDVNIDLININAYNSFVLNSTAITAFNTESYLNFCIREGHDADDQAWGSTSGYNWTYFSTLNAVSNHPELIIDYTPPSEPEPPQTGSGHIYGTGSLIIASSLCSQYEMVGVGSGATELCSQWDHTIEIPALLFFTRVVNYAALSSVIIFFVLFIFYTSIKHLVTKLWCLINNRFKHD